MRKLPFLDRMQWVMMSQWLHQQQLESQVRDTEKKHKIFNMAVFGSPKEKEEKKETKAIFKEIIAYNFPLLSRLIHEFMRLSGSSAGCKRKKSDN